MFYLDTSVVVSALSNEPSSGRARDWIEEAEAGRLCISNWVIAEFSSALSLKLRARRMTVSDRSEIMARFKRYCVENFLILPINAGCFRDAANFADQFSLGLRAPDALHLAICAAHGVAICTLDRRLYEAGMELGVNAQLL